MEINNLKTLKIERLKWEKSKEAEGTCKLVW